MTKPFQITVVDPLFSPDLPVCVNGWNFVPENSVAGACSSSTGLAGPEGPEPDKPSRPSGGIPSAGEILAAIGDGSRTHRIAKRLGCFPEKARYHLKKLEREHLVCRHPEFSYANDIYWIAADGI